MSTEYESPTRSPTTVGYLPWILQRMSALLLVPLLVIHVGVQVYPEYGFDVMYQLGVYQPLLSLTLGLVLLHTVLGVRASVLETRLPPYVKTAAIWLAGLLGLLLLVYRLFG